MDENIYTLRIEKIRGEMVNNEIDVFFVSPSSNLLYLSGYSSIADDRLFLFVILRSGYSFLLAHAMYEGQVKYIPADDFVFYRDGEDAFGILKKEIEKRNTSVKKIAFEPSMPTYFSLPVSRLFSDAESALGSVLTDKLRSYKDLKEIETIARACRESDRALAAVINMGSYWIGKTEAEFSEALCAELQKGGIASYGGCIATGQNAALPHYGVGKTVIENKKCLLVDFWGSLEGYYTDCTRTFHFGRPDKEFEKIYAIVLEAQMAAESKATVGNTLSDIDYAARSVIEKHGYGEYFVHRTGHGLGIDVHEGFSVNKGVDIPVMPDMVFSIEPGIYLPGRFGVRIENLVVTGEESPDILHVYPKELKIIE